MRILVYCLLALRVGVFLRADPGNGGASSPGPVARETLASLKANFTYAPPGGPSSGPAPTYLAESIYLLPKVTVRAAPLPKLDENALLTDKGLSDSFLKRFPGASLPGQSASERHVSNYAAAMHRDEVRLHNMNELMDAAETLKRVGQPAEARKLEQAIDDLFIRNLTDREKAMDRSANGGRAGS